MATSCARRRRSSGPGCAPSLPAFCRARRSHHRRPRFQISSTARVKDPVVIVSPNSRSKNVPQPRCPQSTRLGTDPVMKFIPGISTAPHRIVGVTAILTTNTSFWPSLTVYSPLKRVQSLAAASSSTPAQVLILSSRRSRRSFATCRSTNPLSAPLPSKTFPRRSSHSGSSQHSCVRVLRPLLLPLALVGVAGVLAFSVSARTREFGIG